MLNDVTFGQYYPTKSFMHSADPRTKILLLIAFIVMLFMSNNYYSLLLCGLLLFTAVGVSRVPLSNVLRSIKGIIFIVIITGIITFFFHGGDELLFSYGIIHIYRESIAFTIFFICRLFFLVMASSVLTLTTTPVNLTDGIESLLKPLTYVKFPVHALALIMSIALRFIPTLIDETNRIISAQKARGADFESGNIIRRIKAIIPILIPLLISAFRRAEELGDAMDARCYGNTEKRTKYKKLKFGMRDLVIVFFVGILIAGVILFNMYAAQIFPEIYAYIRLN